MSSGDLSEALVGDREKCPFLGRGLEWRPGSRVPSALISRPPLLLTRTQADSEPMGPFGSLVAFAAPGEFCLLSASVWLEWGASDRGPQPGVTELTTGCTAWVGGSILGAHPAICLLSHPVPQFLLQFPGPGSGGGGVVGRKRFL